MKMTKIDDSALFHGGEYDPAKAREYYLRTRELKGRKKGTAEEPSGRERKAQTQVGKGNAKALLTKASPAKRSATTQAKIDKLKKRLAKLKAVLAELVAAAKKRSGVETKAPAGSKGSDSKGTSHLSAKQKRDAAARSKEYYEKNKDKSPDEQMEALTKQIKEIRAKIKKAIADSKKKPAKKSKSKTASKGR